MIDLLKPSVFSVLQGRSMFNRELAMSLLFQLCAMLFCTGTITYFTNICVHAAFDG